MAPTMWSVFLIVAATIYTGSCQECRVGAPLKIYEGGDRPCPTGYYCHDQQTNILGYCCRQVRLDEAPLTDSYGRVIAKSIDNW